MTTDQVTIILEKNKKLHMDLKLEAIITSNKLGALRSRIHNKKRGHKTEVNSKISELNKHEGKILHRAIILDKEIAALESLFKCLGEIRYLDFDLHSEKFTDSEDQKREQAINIFLQNTN